MRTIRNLSPIPDIQENRNQPEYRRPGRVKCDFLHCCHGKKHFGQIIDLSRNGMRVVRKGLLTGLYRLPKGSKTELLLCWEQTQVAVWSRMAWERKLGMFTYLMGMEFINVTPDMAAVIVCLATKARTSLVIANVEHDFTEPSS